VTQPAENTFATFDLKTQNDDILPPPLKWAGGKRWIVGTLAPLFAAHREKRLVEPFAGGMAVTLGLAPTRALVNDINPHLINFYQQIKRSLTIRDEELLNEREFYFARRARFNQLIAEGAAQTAEAAAIFYYLNRTGFNGLCRFNSKGAFNVPFGRYNKITYIQDFSRYTNLFQQWEFSCLDFEKLPIAKDDILYLDPPYDVQFTKYSKEDFTWNDQERLVAWLSSLTNPIAVSNQATDRVLELYEKAGFTIRKVSGPRRISCTGDREPALEMLALKNI
jgi:DNA adenine methylase